jgi:7-cyano-7-deazaguanine synthase in queuosine biosynthesis
MKPEKIQGQIKIIDKVNEDIGLMSRIEDILVYKRGIRTDGTFIKMPEKGESVVACMSGGQDSIANIGILLKEYGLNVYPFFINRGQSNYQWEKKSVDFFSAFYKKRFPVSYHDVLEIEIATPGKEYKDLLRDTKKMVDDIQFRHNVSYPARNPIIFLTGMEYGYSLQAKGVKVNTLFASHVSSDSSYHCSQTWTRIMNLLICNILNDYSWQFISLPIETDLGNYFDKDVYLKWCYENDIPIHIARTCVKDTELECGDCPCCWDRRRGYKESGIEDPTPYKFDMSEEYPSYYTHASDEKLNN